MSNGNQRMESGQDLWVPHFWPVLPEVGVFAIRTLTQHAAYRHQFAHE